MKWTVYNLLFALAFPFMLPGFLLRMLRRGGYGARMLDRFALYPKGVFGELDPYAATTGFVWIHAVSVGEVQVAGQLMREWRKAEPGVKFCFSTTSSTGWRMAEREVTDGDVLIYNPLDFPTFAKAAIRTVKPRAVVLTESEIWPNFIRTAKKSGIPVFLINARVSDRSAPRYRLARWWFGDVFNSFERIFAQSELDKARLVAAGADAGRVEVTGSFKFDVAHRNEAKEAELRAWLAEGGMPHGDKILLGGSTWPGEDAVLLEIVKRLKGVTLVIAPRHFEKADEVEENIRRAGFGVVRRSVRQPNVQTPKRPNLPNLPNIFLADTTGELMGLYGIADAVFVGKSLCAHGSQNMIEPCLCGKPTAVGPYTENFRPVMSDLLEGCGIVQVKDAAELGRVVADWFRRGDGGLGERARAAVLRRTGVVAKCVGEIRGALASGGGIAPRKHGGRRGFAKDLAFVVAPFLIAAAAFLVADLRRGGVAAEEGEAAQGDARGKPDEDAKPLPKFKAVRTAQAYIAMMEKPDAVRVRLVGKDAENYRRFFEGAGLKCVGDGDAAPEGAKFDIVFAGADDADAAAFAGFASQRGVVAKAIDAHRMTVGGFKSALDAFPCADAHFWIVGERDWLITGRTVRRNLKMSAVLDFFARENAITGEAEAAGCGSMQGVFANYAGNRDDLKGAFEGGDLSVPARPDFFVRTETPDIAWITPDDMDADIVERLAAEIRRLQGVRREIVKAGLKFAEPGGAEAAVDAWARALKENPGDVMLLDRLYLMAVNARAFMSVGNVAGAAQCFEAMVAVRPDDAGVLDEYAQCLRMLGKTDLADKARARADELRRTP